MLAKVEKVATHSKMSVLNKSIGLCKNFHAPKPLQLSEDLTKTPLEDIKNILYTV